MTNGINLAIFLDNEGKIEFPRDDLQWYCRLMKTKTPGGKRMKLGINMMKEYLLDMQKMVENPRCCYGNDQMYSVTYFDGMKPNKYWLLEQASV